MCRVVADVMHTGVLSCPQTSSLQDVARRMTDNDVSSLLVIDQQGVMVGIISRTDLVNARIYEQFWKDWRRLTAGHIMTREVVTISGTLSIEDAGKLMISKRIHRIVVQDPEGKAVGIISLTDLVRDLARGEELSGK